MRIIILFVGLLVLERNVHAQGFLNLNFESAIIRTNGAPPFSVVASNAIPGWTAYLNGISRTYISFNSINIDEPAVTLQGTNSSYITPIQGNYSVFLQGGTQFAFGTNSAIGQTGQIPLSSLSLLYWGGSDNALRITFGSQALSFNAIGSTANYTIYGADISAYAGQTAELLFTASRLGGGIIDNIQFSTQSIPEPSSLTLGALGAFLLGFRYWKKTA